MSERSVKITVSGKVQGVWYRDSTRTKAKELNITGYVRNLPDGNVEVVATGRSDDIEALVEWLHHGPPNAIVSGVETRAMTPSPFSGFTVR